MQITLNQVKNLSYVVIDDLYLPEEVERIKDEARALIPCVQTPEETNVAMDANGNPQNTGIGLFLDTHYADRSNSAILTLNRKIFCEEIVAKATELNQLFYVLRNCNYDTTLVNFYEADEEYKPHRDRSALSAVTFFSLGNISGGDFEFPEVEVVVPFKENRAIIFPGCAVHTAKQTIAAPGAYRLSVAQFLNYVR
jgi:hypothetical protein